MALIAKFLKDGKHEEEEIYNIISFLEDDNDLRNYFFNFFENLFLEEKNKKAEKIKSSIVNLNKLFSHRKKESRKTMMGLWSELIIILFSEDTDVWANNWHSQNRATFDFEFPETGLDVKSFGGHIREHKFQIEQLNNKSVRQTLILSMCLKESDTGTTVLEVLNKIEKRLKNESNKAKVRKLLFSLAGKKITNSTRFSESIAMETLLLLRGKDIPSLNPKNTPKDVSEVRFKSNCEKVKGLTFNKKNQELIKKGKIL